MITIDGKPLDLAAKLPNGVTLKPGGFIEQLKDGTTIHWGYPTGNDSAPERSPDVRMMLDKGAKLP